MHVSDKIGGLNAARFGSWTPAFTPENAKQALLAFKGDVYTGLDAQSFSEADFDYAQKHLRMLSGLYGLLRPLDLMQPYRLEMGTKLANARGKDLYAFWGTRISEWLNEALADQGDDVLLNLASNEYFSAVKRTALNARIINTEFKDLKNGQYKIISFYAKKARGLMSRFVIQEKHQRSGRPQTVRCAGLSLQRRTVETGQSGVFARPRPGIKHAECTTLSIKSRAARTMSKIPRRISPFYWRQKILPVFSNFSFTRH